MGIYKKEYVFDFFKDNQEEIQRKIQILSKKIIELMTEPNFDELGKLLLECKSIGYSAQGYLEEAGSSGEEHSMLVDIGYARALLDMMQMYLQKLTIQNEIQQIRTKYRDKVLSVLVKSGTLLHKDLASAVGVSASGLTAIIKQMNETAVKMVHIEEVSKFKLYSVTPAAYQYVIQKMPGLAIEIEPRTDRNDLYLRYALEISRMIKCKKEMELEKEYKEKAELFSLCDEMIRDKKGMELEKEYLDRKKVVKLHYWEKDFEKSIRLLDGIACG